MLGTPTTAIIHICVHNINKNKYYWEIQAAVDDASAGDTIYVSNGTYYENIVIDKSITLIGENRDTTIIESEWGNVVEITANGVNISGFTIRNRWRGGGGVRGLGVWSDDNVIANNTVTNNDFGIMLGGSHNSISSNNIINNVADGVYVAWESSFNIIRGNTIENNHRGIVMSQSSNNSISRNTISDSNENGIFLYVSDDTTISGNIIANNNLYGIFLYGSCNNNISANIIIDNDEDGIYLSEGSNGNIIKENTIANNNHSGIHLHSLWAWSCDDNNISENNISNNTEIGIYLESNYAGSSCNNRIFRNVITSNDGYGIYLWGHDGGFCENNVIEGNTISDNNYGINLSGMSDDNLIYHNNFINNTQHAYDECDNIWDDGYPSGGNYWSDYTGSDNYHGPDQNISGSDGIGDTPYNISGDSNQDHYPLMASYPSVDLIIANFSATHLFEKPAYISAEHNSKTIKLTAMIKNVGTADITIPFKASFYRKTDGTIPNDTNFNSIIGTVEIPSLGAGETAEATIYWRPQPARHIISVCADSTKIIEESNESNNCASITISYLVWNSLKKTVDVYTRLSRQYQTQCGKKVIVLAQEALSAGVFTNPQEYVQRMETIAELEYKVGSELEGQMPGSLLLQKYQETVEHLISVIDELIGDHISLDITWEDAEDVAGIQLQICKIVEQMLN